MEGLGFIIFVVAFFTIVYRKNAFGIKIKIDSFLLKLNTFQKVLVWFVALGVLLIWIGQIPIESTSTRNQYGRVISRSWETGHSVLVVTIIILFLSIGAFIFKKEKKESLNEESDLRKPSNNIDDISDEIRKLAKLKEEGLISEEDYNKKKSDILG